MRRACVIAGLVVSLLLVSGTVANAADKPTFDLKWYGYFKLDGSYDQNLTSHGNYVMWVEQPIYNKDNEQFNMTANQTRFGFLATGIGYKDVQVGGKLEFDLYAGASGPSIVQNEATLQLRHAYFTIQSSNTKLLAGQSWDLISPLNPATLNYAALWGCGNIGYLRPQVSLWHTAPVSPQTDVTFAGGFFRTIGEDLTPTLTLAVGEIKDGDDDGTDAGIPSLQGLFEVKHTSPSGTSVRVGASALWGKLKAETNQGNSQTYESWAAVGHMMVSFPNGFGFAGEAFTGINLGSYFGGILQSSSIDGVETMGGWASAWVKPSPKVKLAAGFGLDDPKDDDIAASDRSKNTSYFGNIRYYIVQQASIGLEVSQWETEYKNAGTAKNLRVQTSFVLNF